VAVVPAAAADVLVAVAVASARVATKQQ
jgi:hypothetical protein